MPKLLSKITFQNYKLPGKAVFGKLLILILLLFSYSACTDQGCIEADDFGEYEQEILFVKANALGESCEYDPTKSLSDALQGTGLKSCFTSGHVVINDGINPVDAISDTGCSGFEANPTVKNLCIEDCRQKCVNSNSADAASAEPDWVSTTQRQSGRNAGVTITPGAKIFIRAVGTVVLGGVQPETIFARSTDSGLQSKAADFSPAFMDVTGGSTKDIKFSGIWNSGATIFGGNSTSNTPSIKESAFNGTKTLAAYVIPHPPGYKFDTSKSTELIGTRGTPLYVDTRLWTCSYSSGDRKQSLCNSLPYDAHNEYPFTDNATALSLYQISSSIKASNLGSVGGMIRYNNDGLEPLDNDPFATTSCNPACSGVPADTKGGGFVGDLSTGSASIANNADYAVRVVFKNLGAGVAGDNCNINLVGTITDKNGTIITSPPQTITVNKEVSWSAAYVALEPGDRISFVSNAAKYGATSTGCGNVIAFRFNKLQDIAINKSGFVSFTRLAMSGSAGACSLKGRVINPNGSRVDFNGVNSADFYEYDSFSTGAASIDPIKNLNVPLSNATSPVDIFNKTFSDKLFVRKGQVIRFDPESWNGTWSSGNGDRECGIGTAMQIEERPAFLCRGKAQENAQNPLCKPGTDVNGGPICQRFSDECFLDTSNRPVNPAKYCPNISCQDSFDPATCASVNPFNISAGTCSGCKAAKDAAGNQPLTIPLNLVQCYDLENYTGKVSNISRETGFSDNQLADASISKGARKLPAFDGNYGNFSNFVDDKTNAGAGFNNNKIYRLSQPALFANDGRLKFVVIDNNAFIDNPVTGEKMISAYSDNGSVNDQYNGTNGYKIDLAGRQEFKNGQWLEAILCQETNDGSHVCSSENIPIRINDQPDIVNIRNPVTMGQDPAITSFYQFDPFGSISRFDNPVTGLDVHVSPTSDLNALTKPGDNFYRHGFGFQSDTTGLTEQQIKDNKSKVSRLRISFKIKDPEIGNCKINNVDITVDPFSQNCAGGCDGIVVENHFYDGSIAGNTNKICASDKAPGTEATQCQEQFFCANKYYNNEGKYQVIVKVENKGSNISDIVNKVISPVIEIMDGSQDGTKIGQAERVYTEIVKDGRFQLIVQMLVIMMITFWGVGYLMGVSEFSQSEIVTRIIKVGVIYLFISPEGWYWFDKLFVNFFKHGTDYVTFLMASSFDRSTELQQAISTNSFYDKSILFSGIDKVFGMFFSSAVQKKISALLFASIFGWAYLYIIYLSFFLYVYAVANAVLLYLTAQVFISILFVLGPLFFLALLFNMTKTMFDKWLDELIGFSLQQVFLLTTLAFFNMMMYEIMKMSLGYRVCWDDVWVINIYITRIKLLSFWTIASLPPRLNAQSEVGNIGNPEGIPSIFSILFIWIIASLMSKFIGFMTDLGASIGGSLQASAMGAGIKAAGQAMHKQATAQYKQRVGKHLDSAAQSIDRAVFDSGKKADGDRDKKAAQDKADSKNRNTLAKAGADGVSKFRRENALKYAEASPEKRTEMLTAAKTAAMETKRKEMGLSPEDAKKLIEGKSKITNARDLGGLAKEAWQKRASLGTGIANKDIDSAMTGSEMKAAMKNASNEDKLKLQDKVKSGDLKLKSTSKERASQNLSEAGSELMKGNVGGAITSLGKAATQRTLGVAGDKVSGALSSAASTAKSGGKGVANFVSDRESSGKIAREQLEAEGKIKPMAKGTQWAASAADKKQIQDRADQNKQQQAIHTKQLSSGDAEFMAKLSGGQAPSAEERQNSYKDQLLVERSSTESVMKSAQTSYEASMEKVDSIDSGSAMTQHATLLENVENASTESEKKDAQEALGSFQNSDEYIAASKKRAEALDEANVHKNTMDNADAKIGSIDDIISDVENPTPSTSDKVKSNVLRAFGKKNV